MRRRIVLLLAALGLVAVGLAVTEQPASAHNYDNYSWIFCQAGAQSQQVNSYVAHSWPIYMDPDVIIYWCAVYLGTQYRTFRVWVSTHDASWITTNWCNPNWDPVNQPCYDQHPPGPYP